ncbi:MAG: hypothetical protein GC196_13525 [Hyphomonas sp.]|nr:hypothetical protein [Hyphomonas sp.]
MATAFAATSLAPAVGAAAFAQGEDVAEAEVFEPAQDWVEPEADADEFADEPADAVAEPEAAAAAQDEVASDGDDLPAPGSTAESDPGGSTKPGTTPDD